MVSHPFKEVIGYALKERGLSVLLIPLLLGLLSIISRNSYLLFLCTLANINTIAVIGLSIVSGYTGQLHLGQAAFMGIGAYTSAILSLKYGYTFWSGLLLAVVFSAVFGVILGIPALKLKGGPYLALVTQTFGELVYVLLLNLVWLTGGPFGLAGIPYPAVGRYDISSPAAYLLLTLAFLVITYFVAKKIVHSRFGRAFLAVKESEDAAQSIGINIMKYKIMAFAISAAAGGVAGCLYGPFIGFISPDQFTWMPSLILISMGIVGGISDLPGAILGAYLLTFLPEQLRVAQQFRMILYSCTLLLTLLFLPNGLISLWGLSWHEIKGLFRSRLAELSDFKQSKQRKASKSPC